MTPKAISKWSDKLTPYVISLPPFLTRRDIFPVMHNLLTDEPAPPLPCCSRIGLFDRTALITQDRQVLCLPHLRQ
ncbi:hypothetical protein BD779DRAFT_1534158 [Infundibulicybe gibba]|nr:hypothetical protein BD779DRAFT_1534158 [Infundibulicybe gibba]